MKFSTQNLLSIRDWQTHAEVYQNAVTECRLADELGFDVVWLAEHHFSHFMAPSHAAAWPTTRSSARCACSPRKSSRKSGRTPYRIQKPSLRASWRSPSQSFAADSACGWTKRGGRQDA